MPPEIGPKNKHYPPMTRQQFQFVAEIIASIEADRPAHSVIVSTFVEGLAHTNPYFREDYFRQACVRNSGQTS